MLFGVPRACLLAATVTVPAGTGITDPSGSFGGLWRWRDMVARVGPVTSS